MNWASEKGKSGLIKMLMQKHGITKRKAEKAVNAVFDCMASALKRGEVVELPVGTAVLDSPPPGRKRTLQKFSNIQTGKKFIRQVSPPKEVIRFRPDKRLIQRGPFPPPPPPPPSPALIQKGVELDQLLTQLGFSSPTLSDIQSLLAAADDNPLPELAGKMLDRLLARLRELVKRGRTFRKIYLLRGAVSDLIWIR